MIFRREVVAGGSLAILFGSICAPCCAAAQLSGKTRGCHLASEDYEAVRSRAGETQAVSSGSSQTIWKSGDSNFDFALAHTLSKICIAFQVLPGFAYYEDGQSLNAYATQNTSLARTDGSVFFGLNFLKQVRTFPESPEVAVATICAHEFGHIVQYKNNLIPIVNRGQFTVKRSELQADYFAGYFTGLRKLEMPTYPAAVAAMAQFRVGDNLFSDAGHHGTPEERGGAVVRGFEASFREKKTLSEAISESTNYVLQL
jgi:hypothetical protein